MAANILALSCSTSSLRTTVCSLAKASHRQNGDAEQSVSSSIHSEEVRTPLVINSRHDVGPYTDLKRGGMMSDDHEWQAQHIVGERQTPSGLEHEVSVQKTLWLPRATLDTKLVRRYRAEHRAAQ
jgi:hypothetical protein